MDNPYFVDVLNPRDELMKHFDCFSLKYAFVFYYMIEQFSLFHVLHDQKELFGSLYDFVKLYDVGMTDEFQDMDLAGDSFDIRHFGNLAFLQYFYSDILIGGFMDG